jgi:large subunit ribosomal protein L17
MRHLVDGRKFGINTSHRKAMFKTMANNLLRHEQIVTTVPKAKELRRVVDRLITLGKKGSLHAKRTAFDRTRDRDSVVKLFGTLAERYAKRAGGYVRVLRMDGTRWGDGAEMAIVELVDRPVVEKKKKAPKKAAKGHEGHDHDHDHDDHGHDHDHAHGAPKKARAGGGKKGKVSGTAASAKGAAKAPRKAPSKSGGGSSS